MNDATDATCALCNRALEPWLDHVVDPQTRDEFQIFRCPACRHEQTWPVPADLARYYGPMYYGRRHGFTADYCMRRRVRFVGQVTRAEGERKLLDVGCGDGSFLSAIERHGWRVTGTEMNPEPARAYGLSVFATLDEAAREGPFGCITLWHVLEHMQDPLTELTKLRTLIAPDGVLVVAVPNAASTQAKLWGRHWLHRDVPRHLHHFSPASLHSHLERSGFEVVRTWYGEFEYDLLGWAQSALNCALSEPNVFFQLLTGRDASLGAAKRLAHMLLGASCCGAALLPTWTDILLRRSGTLILASRPASTPRP